MRKHKSNTILAHHKSTSDKVLEKVSNIHNGSLRICFTGFSGKDKRKIKRLVKIRLQEHGFCHGKII